MAVSQEDINDSIRVEQDKLVHWMINAGKQDAYGNWDKSECFADKSEKSSLAIGVLETGCEGKDISDFVNENTSPSVRCDLTKVGIGYDAVERSTRDCRVIRVPLSNVPPPYGEFTQLEFVTVEFTEVITE